MDAVQLEGRPLPPFPPRLVSAAERLRISSLPAPAHIREFREALIEYCRYLRDSGLPRDQVVSTIWPTFVGVVPTQLITAAKYWCLAVYDRAD
jgi:hypothetical protein